MRLVHLHFFLFENIIFFVFHAYQSKDVHLLLILNLKQQNGSPIYYCAIIYDYVQSRGQCSRY